MNRGEDVYEEQLEETESEESQKRFHEVAKQNQKMRDTFQDEEI